MSQHGYTVDHGWFNGVCSGAAYAPIEKSRRKADAIVAEVRADVVVLLERAAQFRAGSITPSVVETDRWDHKGRCPLTIPWADADDYQRRDGVRRAIERTVRRAEMGTRFADQLAALVERVHGQPLLEVKVEAGPAPICYGERRSVVRNDGELRVVTATRIERGRVYWKDDRGYKGWDGFASWRKLALIPAPAAASGVGATPDEKELADPAL
jgi:hypothetical protein